MKKLRVVLMILLGAATLVAVGVKTGASDKPESSSDNEATDRAKLSHRATVERYRELYGRSRGELAADCAARWTSIVFPIRERKDDASVATRFAWSRVVATTVEVASDGNVAAVRG